jgi:uncharacterized membrane protein YgaE (UPF0421/DUF939 family)
MKTRLLSTGLFLAALVVGFCAVLLVRLEMQLPAVSSAAASNGADPVRAKTPPPGRAAERTG